MKYLAIHTNKIFFQQGTPNVYEFFAMKNGKKNEYEALSKTYEANRSQGPLLLNETFSLCTQGLSLENYKSICNEYWSTYADKEQNEKHFSEWRKKYDRVAIYTSYPQAVYQSLQQEKLLDAVYGVRPHITEDKIDGIESITYKHADDVKEMFHKLGIEKEFTTQPNRYGLLGLCIEDMLKHNIGRENTDIIGKTPENDPFHLLAMK